MTLSKGGISMSVRVPQTPSGKEFYARTNKGSPTKKPSSPSSGAPPELPEAARIAPSAPEVTLEQIKGQQILEAQKQAAAKMKLQLAKKAQEEAMMKLVREERLKAQEAQHSQPFEVKVGHGLFQQRAQQKAEKHARKLVHAQQAKQRQQKKKPVKSEQDNVFFVPSLFEEPAAWTAACKQVGAPKRMIVKKQVVPQSPTGNLAASPTTSPVKKVKQIQVHPETYFVPQLFHHVVGFAMNKPVPPKYAPKKAILSPEAAKAKIQHIMKMKKNGQALHKKRAESKKQRSEPNWGGPDGVAELFSCFPVPETWVKACKMVGGIKKARK